MHESEAIKLSTNIYQTAVRSNVYRLYTFRRSLYGLARGPVAVKQSPNDEVPYRPRDHSVFLSSVRREMRRAAHLSRPSLRPLVAVVRSARLSRNVRISRGLMPYHHKAPQHLRARHVSRIVSKFSCAVGGAAAVSTAARRRARPSRLLSRTRVFSARSPRTLPLLPSRYYYAHIINKIIVEHQTELYPQPVDLFCLSTVKSNGFMSDGYIKVRCYL